MRALVLLAPLFLATPALAAPKKKPPGKMTPEQKEADRHFKSGVALFGEQKFTEALAEFERAYDTAPAPIVLYNIAACHRELSHYGDAVKYYNRFLTEGAGKVAKDRLASAKGELDQILARIARVTVVVTPADATLALDGTALDKPEMPLIVAPGEHKLHAHADGKVDADKTVRVASGDEVTVEVALADVPAEPAKPPPEVHERIVTVAAPEAPKRFALAAGFGTNLQQLSSTGAPAVGLGVAIGSRLELGVDVTLVAYAVMPSVRVRLAGDRLAVQAIAALPVAFTDGAMSETFIAGAGGLGIRFRATPAVSLHVEGLASYAGKTHGITFPAFVGGAVWF